MNLKYSDPRNDLVLFKLNSINLIIYIYSIYIHIYFDTNTWYILTISYFLTTRSICQTLTVGQLRNMLRHNA